MNGAKERPHPFRRTRRDHATETAEDYVEAIAAVISEQGRCRSADLARIFDVSPVTVNKTVARLERDGLIKTRPYAPLELTAEGHELAAMCRRRHELVYELLLSLGVSGPVAHADAEGMEHHVSDETLRQIRVFLQRQRSGG